MIARRALLIVAQYVVSLAILLAAWDALVRIFDIPPYVLPPPETVVRTLFEYPQVFLRAARVTFGNMLLGGTAGIVLGLAVGMLIAYSRLFRWVVEPYLVVFQSFPREALFPLFAVWLGFGVLPKIINAALLCFFPVTIITSAALLDTNEDYLRLIRSWKASRAREFFSCRLPAAVPSLLGGVKVGLPLALIGAVLGEIMGGNDGLGYIIVSASSAYSMERVFASILLLGSGGVVILALLNVLQSTALRRFKQG